MYSYLIAIGSNLGERETYIEASLAELAENGVRVVKTAGFYETKPIGNADKLFLNSAALCESLLPPESFLQLLLRTERGLGRKREVHWGNRTIDLDIILAKRDGVLISVNSEDLVIPHPRAHERDFVLLPCREIAPTWIDLWLAGRDLRNEKGAVFTAPR